MCRKTELLAPAGSYRIMQAVIEAGADAVYAAGSKFGARAYAANFTEEEMLSAIDYAHIKGKRLYLTVNTLLKEREMQELFDYLCPLYEAGLDAVIVQDIGVMHFIREQFPKLPIHASTQMTVTGAYGARLLLKHGCSRIVAARELSLAEISDIHEKTGAEIEAFIHGALCYSYSGQCLLSSMIGGRSGNRGRCAQPCRLPYSPLKEMQASAARKKKQLYPLSLKDLCTIEMIPELVESGINSFKIEGRMKQEEYAAGVTGMYRKYLDLYEADPQGNYEVNAGDYQKLLDLGSRCGFTDGYYKRQNGKEMVTFEKPSHEKKHQAQTDGKLSGSAEETKEKIKGFLRLSKNNPAHFLLEYKGLQAEVTGDVVEAAKKQPLTREAVCGKLQKTGNTPFELESLQLEMEEGCFLTVSALNQLRRMGIEKLTELVLGQYRRTLPDAYRALQSPRKGSYASGEPADSEIALSVLAETEEQFEASLSQPEAGRIYLEAFAVGRRDMCRKLGELSGQAHLLGKEFYLALPHVFRMETARWYCENWQQIAQAGIDGCLIRNLEELSFLREMGMDPSMIQGDSQLYVSSNEAILGWEMLSLQHYTLPSELNARELRDLDCSGGELVIYGYQPLMLSAQCIHKNTAGCDKSESVSYLKDRYGKLFSVKNHCEDCYNILYNISPLALFRHFQEIQALRPARLRLSFTIESGREVERMFGYYRQARAGSLDEGSYLPDFTNGHFKRGVE